MGRMGWFLAFNSICLFISFGISIRSHLAVELGDIMRMDCIWILSLIRFTLHVQIITFDNEDS